MIPVLLLLLLLEGATFAAHHCALGINKSAQAKVVKVKKVLLKGVGSHGKVAIHFCVLYYFTLLPLFHFSVEQKENASRNAGREGEKNTFTN